MGFKLIGLKQEVIRIPTAASPFPDLYEASIAELQAGLQVGLFTSVDLVKACFARIEEVNLRGPALRAFIETNPSALAQAAELDRERRKTAPRSALHGIPLLLKDNIATLYSEGHGHCSSSYAILGSVVPRDAHVAAKLRAAGAILLGKANLSQWANFHGAGVPSGFSARGGQASNPYVPLGSPSGSSSGSGIAAAIGLAAATLGTETDGSIVLPSSANNVVGIKPSMGLTSRGGVSRHSGTNGAFGCGRRRSIIAGRDPRDNYTSAAPAQIPDYTRALDTEALRGARIGVPRRYIAAQLDGVQVAAFNASLATLRKQGATIADVKVSAGLHKVPTGVKTLADLIAFNIAHADEELVPPYWADQSVFITADNTTIDQAFYDALAADLDLGATRGIDAALKAFELDALILPTNIASTPSAIAGHPNVTVPLGFCPPDTPLSPAEPTRKSGPNMPFGLAFLGTAFSEFKLISLAYVYEQATHTRLKVRAFPAAIPKTQLADVIGT
ncbi:amidase signature enzyme [Trametes versicolor FP-101664 SS1]|uniref:amidase signature enzyme n=1 Tax=Trametes versicolor (strain FP-101664) TaxID=717944 RepID=UPI0004622BED|nr:amidase signature enzyme [Trametes versicolor FP-101664 SS1]EIW53237.1 amidase signature enzyme [Trametes versicolor FP-101664 SS1]